MTKEFNKAWGVKPSLENERARFVARIKSTLFSDVSQHRDYWNIFRKVCFYLGVDPEPHMVNRGRRAMPPIVPPHLRDFCEGDFFLTLRIITCVYRFGREDVHMVRSINHYVDLALQEASSDLGISWKDGMFYPRGAEELDVKLTDSSLVWLDKYPEAKKEYQDSLTALAEGRLNDAVTNSYVAIERLAQRMLENGKTLDNNKGEFLKSLNLSQEWGGIVGFIFKFSNEFGRHASKRLAEVKPNEVEGYVYMAGTIIRLASLTKS